MEVFFYELYEWIGFPEESLEMGEPIFFSKETLPYHEMMPADKVIFENLFQGKNLAGEVVLFGKDAEPVFRLI